MPNPKFSWEYKMLRTSKQCLEQLTILHKHHVLLKKQMKRRPARPRNPIRKIYFTGIRQHFWRLKYFKLNSDFHWNSISESLQGTQSSNPHNDYCQHFVDTGQRPQNFIRDVGLTDRFEEYPKLRELIRLKDELISETATPPMYFQADLKTFDLKTIGTKFDVILIEPPLEEYAREGSNFWNWDEILNLEIDQVASHRSFVFLWCGSSYGLDLGRNCLRKWGFRRCEDICWIRTNINSPSHTKILEPKAVFQRTKVSLLSNFLRFLFLKNLIAGTLFDGD